MSNSRKFAIGNKRGVEMPLSKIVGMIMLLIVLVAIIVAFFGSKGMFPQVSEYINDKVDSMMDTLRLNSKAGSGEQDNQDISAVKDSLVELFEEKQAYITLKESGQLPCLIKYDKASKNFEKYEIRMNRVGEGKGDIFINILTPGNSVVGTTTVKDKNLCIVNGANFYDSFIKKTKEGLDLSAPMDEIVIKDKGPNLFYNGAKAGMKDGGLLLLVDDKNLCFFATKYDPLPFCGKVGPLVDDDCTPNMYNEINKGNEYNGLKMCDIPKTNDKTGDTK